MSPPTCAFCGLSIPASASCCPHCGRPSLFPNVSAVAQKEETEALNGWFHGAVQAAGARGCQQVVTDFIAAAARSNAVIARPLGEAQRLASSEKQGYATYYELVEAEARLPDGDEWDALRRRADLALFTGYEKNMRFAALSLDAVGLSNYGECSMTLRAAMIGHRATVFEGNSAALLGDLSRPEATARIRGRRSSWDDRAKVCTAKLAPVLQQNTTAASFPGILLAQGKTSADDSFVEVHVYGPMTIHSFERVAITRKRGRAAARPIRRALERDLAKHGVAFEDRT